MNEIDINAQLWRLRVAARGLLVRAGLHPYRPVALVDPGTWNADYARGDWDRLGSVTESARYSVLLGYLELIGGEFSILDVGCGAGLFRKKLGNRPFKSYLGVDVSSVAIDEAQALRDDRTRFEVCEPVPPNLGTFDVVLCNEVLYCVERPSEFLDAMSGMVAPGGHFLTSLWRHQGDEVLHRMIDERFDVVDRVELRNLASSGLRWRLACHRRADPSHRPPPRRPGSLFRKRA